MLPDQEAVVGSKRMVWKCIGCGREVLQDATERLEDERLRARLIAAQSPAYVTTESN
jgi:hypothetical protein